MTETEIQSGIIKALNSIPGVRVWRANVDHRGRVKCGITGQADITGAFQHGKRLEIEVKTENGVQSAAQIEFQRRCEELGIAYCLARSVEEAVDFVLREGEL